MRCPFCRHPDTKVTDTRLSQEGAVVRRRRMCPECERRFTTNEEVEQLLPMIIKKDGRREEFQRHKIMAGLQRACEKRPVSAETIEWMVDEVERRFHDWPAREVPSARVGEAVMEVLKSVDEVAYVRFASVYRSFKDVSDFMDELRGLVNVQKHKR